MTDWMKGYKVLEASGARAIVAWRIEDVKSLAPQLTDKEAMDFLERNAKNVEERMTERGFEAIEDLLNMEGIEVTGEPGDFDF